MAAKKATAILLVRAGICSEWKSCKSTSRSEGSPFAGLLFSGRRKFGTLKR